MRQDYARKARILRRIMSNKAAYYRRMDTLVNSLTIVVASLVTFVGFYGIDKLHEALSGGLLPRADLTVFSFWFNFITFSLLILIFLQLFFRFGDRKSEAERAIVSLSTFINFIRDRSAAQLGFSGLADNELAVARERYESIIASIPANTDEEYRVARIQEGGRHTDGPYMSLQSLGDPIQEEAIMTRLIRSRASEMKVLSLIKSYRRDLWVAGGIFRNLAWDGLHAFDTETPFDDVDVVYFDELHSNKAVDEKIESDLRQIAPGIEWSVKNQARMHIHNKESAYHSLEDAIAKFPEICSAFAVRLGDDDEIEYVAPYGFTDVLSLLIRPTPHFEDRSNRLSERVVTKHWLLKWPKLRTSFRVK